MSARFWFSAGMLFVVCFCLFAVKHHRAKVLAQQQTQAAIVDSTTAVPPSNPQSQHGVSPVVHGLPTSKDTGDLAMEWNVWVVAERTTEHGSAAQIESRLPWLTVERQKIAGMPMRDGCAHSTQEAEVDSMDADIVYFKARMQDFHSHKVDSPDEQDAAQHARNAANRADQMAMKCVTP